MSPAQRLPPPAAPPALRLLERPQRPPVPRAPPVPAGFWQRWADALRRAR